MCSKFRKSLTPWHSFHRNEYIAQEAAAATSCFFPKYKAIVPVEDHSELTLAVINLPRKYREAIMLYYYQDMDTAEIGIAMGIAQSSVSNRLRKGRELLRIAMEGRKQNA